MREHELKTWPQYFAAVLDGSKTFEARLDDRGFEVGDVLWLREWDLAALAYTGREVRRTVSYKLSGDPFVAPGYCILALAPAPAVAGEAVAWQLLGIDVVVDGVVVGRYWREAGKWWASYWADAAKMGPYKTGAAAEAAVRREHDNRR